MAKAEQTEIPGYERPVIAACDKAAKEYEKAKAEHADTLESKQKAAGRLQKALQSNVDKLQDRDKDGNPGYVYIDDGEMKIAILKRSEEGIEVHKWKPPKPPKAGKDVDA